jgi:hypothetical protein
VINAWYNAVCIMSDNTDHHNMSYRTGEKKKGGNKPIIKDAK